MIVLDSPDKLNKEHLGYSWFSNPNRIKDPDFKQQLHHLKTKNVYIVKAEIPIEKVDVPRSLWQRSMMIKNK